MTAKSVYDWVSYVERAILDLDDIPILGQSPEFSWDMLTKELSEYFGLPNLMIKPLKWDWRTQERLLENLGEDLSCLSFSVLPLQGKVNLLFPAMDMNSLVTWLTEKRRGEHEILNAHFKRGLIAYTSVEILNHLQKMPFFDGFLLRYLSDQSLPSQRALTLDLKLEAFGEALLCRVVIPEIFRKGWRAHFLERPPHLSQKNIDSLEFSCALQAGQISQSIQEWKKVKRGDFVPVENCQIDPETKTGSLNLMLENKALFRLRIKDEGLKILVQPIYEEESLPMDDEDFMDEEEDGLDVGELDEASREEDEFSEESERPAGSEEEMRPSKVTFEKVEQVPLNISVELTRFKMPCKKLMQLQPGNFIELKVQPEKPVSLVVNGKKIAEGELIRVGDVLGVRILNIG